MSELKKVIELLEKQNERLLRIEKLLQGSPKKIEKTASPKTRSPKQRKTIPDFIIMFKEEGFFDKPRTLKEISGKLVEEGFHFSMGTLSKSMLRLVRHRIVGRIGVKGKWAYVKR